MEEELIKYFQKIYSTYPEIISRAPGRINIIGEHTDYTLGYVLPAAIHKKIYFIASRRKDLKVHVWSIQFHEKDVFSIKKIDFLPEKTWKNYIRGIFNILTQKGFSIYGINGLIYGDIPIGAGLSSSAALEVSILNGLNYLFNLELAKKEIASFAQRVEQDFAGVKCGIMDQFISLFGKENKAIFLNCETLEYEEVPLNLKEKNLTILIYDTRIKRDLGNTSYNQRRFEAEKALNIFKNNYSIKTFKEVTFEILNEARPLLGETLFKRARHIVIENIRVKEAVSALKNDDFQTLGYLLSQSHKSLKDDYEVSCPELDFFYEKGLKFQGCYGARLIGAGFGGSAIALMEKDKIEDFQKSVLKDLEKYNFKKPKFYSVFISSGAEVKILN